MLNQDTTKEVSQTYPNNDHNPLNDHDYCSPDKRLSQTQQRNLEEPNDTAADSLSNKTLPTVLNSKLSLPESIASNSTSLDAQKNVGTVNDGIVKERCNEHLIDSSSSSSSSSLSSSIGSNKDSIIAQHSRKLNQQKRKSMDSEGSLANRQCESSSKLVRDTSMDEGSQDVGRARAKRARQSISVTDKSEWIMGDDQIDSVLSEHLEGEPRERKSKSNRDHSSSYNQYTSSDYSSSDAESDRESMYNSEDDPDRLWCICKKPHDGKFMICCDVCKDWFHGHCVGVTKLMGDRFEKQGKEWFCGECQEKLRAGTPRNAIPEKIIKKETKKKSMPPIPGKRGRGRPRKSESLGNPRENVTRVSQRTTRKSSSSLDPKVGVDNGRLKKNLARSDARSESFDEFENSQRLKVLIKERKKEFFYKRHLAEQRKAAKRNELGLGRQSLTANLGDSLDSLATSTSASSMNNPSVIKTEDKEHSKPNIVLQINTKKDSCTDQNDPSSRIVTAIVRPKKAKQLDASNPIVDDLFIAEPIQINSKVRTQLNTSAQSTTSASGETSSCNGETNIRKRSGSGSSSSKNEKSNPGSGQTDATPKKKRKDSGSSAPNGSSEPWGSKNIVQKIKESLESRSKQMKDIEISADKIESLATEIEGQLNECFKEGTQKYLNKFRSLLFNLRDAKNQGLVKNVLTGEILPARLVRMSPDEMASHELAKWRERENKHSIELIKRDAQLAAQQVIVKKTHKGEEVISTPSLNEPEDPSTVVEEQATPTTPTKIPTKELRADCSKITPNSPQQSGGNKSSGPLKMKIIGITSEFPLKSAHDLPTTPIGESLPFIETTKDHKNHIFDINCKICTKQDSISPETSSGAKIETPTSNEQVSKPAEPSQPDQPKRFRVSIDTKIDPADLSRLKEPLIRPRLPSVGLEEISSPKTSTFSQMIDAAREVDEEETLVSSSSNNPEKSLIHTPDSQTADVQSGNDNRSNKQCWSGSITMPDVAKFCASAKPVSGSVDFMKDGINQNLTICGRIAPDQVQGYIKQLKSTTKNQILIIQLFPLTESDKSSFDSFFDYLYSRNRYGVIQTTPQILKDFYILPVHEKSNIPEMLRPIKGPGIDRKEPNCLLGLLVRSKKAANVLSPSPSTSTYTPTPIN